jgi:hypothetical protein
MIGKILMAISMTSIMVSGMSGENPPYADTCATESTVITLADWYAVK